MWKEKERGGCMSFGISADSTCRHWIRMKGTQEWLDERMRRMSGLHFFLALFHSAGPFANGVATL